MPQIPKDKRGRKVLITYNALHKQDAGPTPELQTLRNCKQKSNALQPEGSKKKEGSNNLQHPAQARSRTYTGTSKHRNPASRKGMPYNPKEVEMKEGSNNLQLLTFHGLKTQDFLKYTSNLPPIYSSVNFSKRLIVYKLSSQKPPFNKILLEFLS